MTQRSRDILQLPAPDADERIPYSDPPLRFGELRLPAGAGPHPLAVVIHGGFWRAAYNLDHIGHLCAALGEVGVATWSLEYRRIGDDGGGWPGTFADVAAGADFVRELSLSQSIDPERVVSVGHSAGGHLALWLASRANLAGSGPVGNDPFPIRGVASLAGVTDLHRAWDLQLSNSVVGDLLGGSPEEVPDRYRLASPIENLPLEVRQRLLHGTLDDIVPPELSASYAARAQAEGDDAQYLPIDRAGHFELIDPRTEAWQRVSGAILDLLN